MISVINKQKSRTSLRTPRGKKTGYGQWMLRVAVVFFAVTVVYVLFFADFLNIAKINISGLNKLEDALIRSEILERLNGKYFGLVKKNNLIIFCKNSSKKELLEKFKRIEDVTIEKKFPNELDVSVKERVFTMQFCSFNKCYLLNERGEVYPAENLTQDEIDGENLITLNDMSGFQFSTEETRPFEDDFRQFIVDLDKRVMQETGIVLKRPYQTPSRVSGDLIAETDEGWRIYFNASIGMDKELLMLKAVLNKKIEKDQQKNLEYISLLVDNKVFYKFKDGVEQTQETQSVPVPEVKKEEKKKKD